MNKIDVYTWSEIDLLCKKLASSIPEKFDVLVSVLRGGAVPGVILANHLEITKMIVAGVGMTDSNGAKKGGRASGEPLSIVVPLNELELKGMRVLVVDDVLDSSERIRIVMEEVKLRGATLVRSAVLQKKGTSRFHPDYYAEEKRNFLFYPWMTLHELEEMERSLSRGDSE